MQTVQKSPFASGSWDADGICLGFFRFNCGGERVYGHNGVRSATLRFIPGRRFAMSVLTNASGGTTLASTLIDGVVNKLFGITLPAAAQADDAVMIDHARYVGTYEHVDRRFRIESADDRLRLINESMWGMAEGDALALSPISETTFLGQHEQGEPEKIGFLEPDGTGTYRYAHIALRAFRRVE
jgi:hypothetical protein